MSKTSMFVKLTTKPGRRGDLLAAFDPLVAAVNDEAGTEIYSVNVDAADENVLWVYEQYTDEDALAAHSSSEAMGVLLTQVGDLLGDAPLMVLTTPVSGKGTGI